MKLILREDVEHLGKGGELVEVKPGYGRNYLLPRGVGRAPPRGWGSDQAMLATDPGVRHPTPPRRAGGALGLRVTVVALLRPENP